MRSCLQNKKVKENTQLLKQLNRQSSSDTLLAASFTQSHKLGTPGTPGHAPVVTQVTQVWPPDSCLLGHLPGTSIPLPPRHPPTPEVPEPGDHHTCRELPALPSCKLTLGWEGWERAGGRVGAQARRPDSVNIYSQAQEAISFLFLLLIERGESGCNTSKGLKPQPERPAELEEGEGECFINAGSASLPRG